MGKKIIISRNSSKNIQKKIEEDGYEDPANRKGSYGVDDLSLPLEKDLNQRNTEFEWQKFKGFTVPDSPEQNFDIIDQNLGEYPLSHLENNDSYYVDSSNANKEPSFKNFSIGPIVEGQSLVQNYSTYPQIYQENISGNSYYPNPHHFIDNRECAPNSWNLPETRQDFYSYPETKSINEAPSEKVPYNTSFIPNPNNPSVQSPVIANPVIPESPKNLKSFDFKIEKFEKHQVALDSEDYPNTVSKSWIPMEKMKKIYQFNEKFQKNVTYLENEKSIIGWKKSRGDGNCYFRAVIVKYFDSIHKVYKSVSKLKDFKVILESHEIATGGYPEYDMAKDYILKYLDEVIQIKESGNFIQAYVFFLNKLQDSEFDLNLVRVSRLLTASNLYKLKETDDIFPYIIDGYEDIMTEMLRMGEEGGGLTLMLLPLALNIQVAQFMYLESVINIQYFPFEAKDHTEIVSIVRRSGHYDILVTKQEIEYEQFNFETGTYHFYQEIEFYDYLLMK